jgi:hypothetical protein
MHRTAPAGCKTWVEEIPDSADVRRLESGMTEFISENDLDTFEGWLKYQAVDATELTSDELAMWRGLYEEGRKAAANKVGLMKLRPVPGEHRYAVAVREGPDLFLTAWVRRSRRGEFFLMIPRGVSDWDPHTSYHIDGTLHMKSFGRKVLTQKRQSLTRPFRGTEHLGTYGGHGPKTVGAICDPAAFSGVVEVAAGVFGPRDGLVAVDLVEPGSEPRDLNPRVVQQREVFRDFVPWVVIRIAL